MVDDDLMSYRNDAVRALAWTIRSPNLMNARPGLGFQTPGAFMDAYQEARSWLRQLDADPTPLLEAIGSVNTWKVGVYFEALMGFWLDRHSEMTVLGHNPQVQDQGRTLGAFDFLLRDAQGRYEHWELAVKFYLQQRRSAEWTAWVGPNQRDRLDLKLNRMRDHQLPLAHTAPGKVCLANLGVPALNTQRAVLKGTLFTPWLQTDGFVHPDGASLDGERGVWIPVTKLDRLLDAGPERRWYRREKPDWLGPAVQNRTMTLDSDGILAACQKTALQRPQLWSQMVKMAPQTWCEERLVFIVPAEWSSSAG